MADKRELLFNFIGKESISPAAKKAGDAIEDLGKDFKRTTDSAQGLDKQAKKTGESVGSLGDDFKKSTSQAKTLGSQVAELEGRIKSTAAEIEKTGDLKLFKQLSADRRDLRKLNVVKDLLGDDGDNKKEAIKVGARLAGNVASGLASAGSAISGALGKVFGTLPPQAQAAIGAGVVAAVVAASSLIAGAISAAVVGGVGIGGVIGGLVIASKHSAVQSASTAVGDTFKKTMQEAAVSFVPVTVTALGDVRAAIVRLGPSLQRVFGRAALYVKPLTQAGIGFAEKLMPGIEKAVMKAGPIIAQIATWLPKLGETLGNGFASLAQVAPEAGRALGTVFQIVNLGTQSIFANIRMLTELYKWLEFTGDALSGNITASIAKRATDEAAKQGNEELAASLKVLMVGFEGAGDKTLALAVQQEELRRQFAEARNAAREERSALDELATALRAQTDPMFALINAQNGLKDSQKEYNKAIKEHGKNSPEAKEALRQMAQAALEVEYATGQAAGTFDGKLSPAMVATLKAAKFTDAQIAALEQQFQTAQAKGDKFAKNYQASAGLTDNASAKARIIRTEISKIHGRTVVVGIKYETSGRNQGEHHIGQGTLTKSAAGGPVTGRGPKGVDSVPHLLAPGEYVLNDKDVDRMGGFAGVEKMRAALQGGGKAAAPAMAAASGGGAAGGGILIQSVTVVANNPDEFVEKLRKKAKGAGGIVRYIDQK